MDPQQLTPALSIDDSPSLSDNESTFGIPAEQVDIIRGIVDKWHKKPLQIASDIVSALVPTFSPQHHKTTTNKLLRKAVTTLTSLLSYAMEKIKK
jgi:hypothetical protein